MDKVIEFIVDAFKLLLCFIETVVSYVYSILCAIAQIPFIITFYLLARLFGAFDDKKKN